MSQLTMFPERVDYRPKVKDLPERDRPVNRIREAGPGSLSTSEILACLLQTEGALGLGERLLAHFGGLPGLCRATIPELCGIPGIGHAQAARIKAAAELGRRTMLMSSKDKITVNSPATIANYLMLDLALEQQEHLWVVLLDTRNQVMEIDKVYKGSLHTTVVRTAELLRNAVRHNAAGIILVHNHPSGDPSPSPEDVRVTEQVVQAGRLMDIHVLDHIIIGGQRYVSLKERGLGFPG